MGVLDKQAALLADARETGLNPVPVEPPKPVHEKRKIGFTFSEMVENATKARKAEDSTIYERNPPKPRGYKIAIMFAEDDVLELEFSSWGTILHYLQSLPDGAEPETMIASRKVK